ncbi:MAG: hypothetical protein NC181_04685 [Clostridium sp.]|nr:hypothetical protein [Clostridium sp.]MCM1444612.1 hypothetical protein [Candidatus Amulumruptor caecigallinarius]
MKKVLGIFVSVITVFALTGCGKGETVTCTLEDDDQLQTMTATFENDKATKVVMESKQTVESSLVDATYSILQSVESMYEGEEGVKVSVSKGNDSVSMKIEMELTKLSDEMKEEFDLTSSSDTSKKSFIDSMTEEGFTCK